MNFNFFNTFNRFKCLFFILELAFYYTCIADIREFMEKSVEDSVRLKKSSTDILKVSFELFHGTMIIFQFMFISISKLYKAFLTNFVKIGSERVHWKIKLDYQKNCAGILLYTTYNFSVISHSNFSIFCLFQFMYLQGVFDENRKINDPSGIRK